MYLFKYFLCIINLNSEDKLEYDRFFNVKDYCEIIIIGYLKKVYE